MKAKSKVAIIGAGNVGATAAMRLLEAGVCDIVLLDIAEGIAKGKAEDLMDAAAIMNHSKVIIGTSDYNQINDSDIVVIAAGLTRKPGMSREELLNKNVSVVSGVVKEVVRHVKNPIIIMVTNPLDIMAYVAYRISGLDSKRVFGMAGILDSARMNLLIARSLGKPLSKVESLMLGTHGEAMVPILSQTKIEGVPIKDIVRRENLADLLKKTKSRGAEIVSYLGSGSAFYAPSAGIFKMVNAVINNTRETIATSCFLQGEYGIEDVYLGVPAVIGNNGIEKIIEIPLTKDEDEQLKAACESIQQQLKALNL